MAIARRGLNVEVICQGYSGRSDLDRARFLLVGSQCTVRRARSLSVQADGPVPDTVTVSSTRCVPTVWHPDICLPRTSAHTHLRYILRDSIGLYGILAININFGVRSIKQVLYSSKILKNEINCTTRVEACFYTVSQKNI